MAYTIESWDDLDRWRSDINAAVIAAAEPFEPVDRWGQSQVACPLCRSRGRGAFGMDGWKLPTGLEMHLDGGGRTSRCPVAEAALIPGRDEMRRCAKGVYCPKGQFTGPKSRVTVAARAVRGRLI